ncbi:glutathione S-transferase, partial [Pseudomonas aeruginosa]|nr:glutathione S-transferase [Pseudomonas aeruginosa]
ALHHARIDHGEQRRPEFLRLNPHGGIPALDDRALGITLFESAAFPQYLAETSERLHPDAPRERWEPLTWLSFHASRLRLLTRQ